MAQALPSFDPYRVLGVRPDASPAAIDAAWKGLLKRHHPDVAADKASAEAMTKRLNDAHDWLRDPIRRARLDAARRPPTPPRSTTPPKPRPAARPTTPPRPAPPRRPAQDPRPAPTQPPVTAVRRTSRPMPWVIGAAAVGILALALGGSGLGRSTTVPAAAVAEASSTACDPSYPSLCIGVGAGDLDCRDIGARRFPVRPPDRYRFDMDGDGIGCE